MPRWSANARWTADIYCTVHPSCGPVYTEHLRNKVVNAMLNLVRDGLKGDVADVEIKYMAWGNSTVAVSSTQTDLLNEIGRKAITKQTSSGVGVLDTLTYLAPYDAVGQIQELGWFAGSSASTGAGSGTMVARVLWTKLKTALESVDVSRVDTIAYST